VSSPLERLRALGFELPRPPEALASYVPTRSVPISTTHQLVWVAGQVPVRDGKPLYTGRVPDEVSIEVAQEAARECALNILAQAERSGGLDRVEQVIQLTAFVLSADGFGEQPRVANAASELLADVLGPAGQHSRIAVGANALPLGVPVEIAAVLLMRSD